MNVDPKVSMWINLVVTLLGAVVGAGAQLTPVFGPGTTSNIVGIVGIIVTILGAVNTYLHGVSSAKYGPLAARPPS